MIDTYSSLRSQRTSMPMLQTRLGLVTYYVIAVPKAVTTLGPDATQTIATPFSRTLTILLPPGSTISHEAYATELLKLSARHLGASPGKQIDVQVQTPGNAPVSSLSPKAGDLARASAPCDGVKLISVTWFEGIQQDAPAG